MAAADSVGFEEQRDRIGEGLAIQRDRLTFLKAHDDLSALTAQSSRQNGTPMIGLTMLMPLSRMFEILGLVGRAEDIAVGRVGFFGAHLVAEAVAVMNADISARPPSSSMNGWSSQGL